MCEVGEVVARFVDGLDPYGLPVSVPQRRPGPSSTTWTLPLNPSLSWANFTTRGCASVVSHRHWIFMTTHDSTKLTLREKSWNHRSSLSPAD